MAICNLLHWIEVDRSLWVIPGELHPALATASMKLDSSGENTKKPSNLINSVCVAAASSTQALPLDLQMLMLMLKSPASIL